jgi:hypothetical protein
MPKEVKEYECEFCGRQGFSLEAALSHETNCIKNPAVSAVWEECISCQGTGNAYGKQRSGVIGFAQCSSCGGSGRRKRMTAEDIEKICAAIERSRQEREKKKHG